VWEPRRIAAAPRSRGGGSAARDDACDALRAAVIAHAEPVEPGFATSFKRLAAEATAAPADAMGGS